MFAGHTWSKTFEETPSHAIFIWLQPKSIKSHRPSVALPDLRFNRIRP